MNMSEIKDNPLLNYSGLPPFSQVKPEHVKSAVETAIERCKKLFSVKYANVQPHSGSQANMAAYRALLQDKDIILGMSLDAGGHLTHGYKLSFSGQTYTCYSYGVNPETGYIDYDEVER